MEDVNDESYSEVNKDIQENFNYDDSDFISKPVKKSRKKLPIILGVVLGVVIVGAACTYFFVRTALDTRPPIREDRMSSYYVTPVDPAVPLLPGQAPAISKPKDAEYTRIATKYTFLVMSTDDGGGNTDVIMVASFDTTNQKMDIVNIPRDTLMNVSWSDPKKANSVFNNMMYAHGWDQNALSAVMDDTIEKFADILGFKVDYWIIVDMKAFVALIDAIDGVDFYIPVNMNYDDFQAGLSIHYTEGLQHLYGKEALQVMRYRRGYSNQDIGRIGTQQDFLLSAAQQILEKRTSINVTEFASLLVKYVKTDLELSHLIWFGKEFLKLNADNIDFHIMPGNYSDGVGDTSYVTIYVDEWLEIINEVLNTYEEEILPEDLSILTRDSNGYLYVTDGNRQGNASWGSSRGQAYAPGVDAGVSSQAANVQAAPGGDSISGPGSVGPRVTVDNPGVPDESELPEDSEPGEDEEPAESEESLPEGEIGEAELPEEGETPESGEPSEDGEESPPEAPGEPITEPVDEAPEGPPPEPAE